MDREEVLKFMRMKGPVLPVHVSSKFKKDTITMGAVLSEMSHNKKILISNTKIGGSPVYYLPEHKDKLQDLYKYLNEKDKRSYDLLKENKVLRDSELDPLTRVSLRNIRDFAKPLEVNLGGNIALFWKWYLFSQEETISRIKLKLGISDKKNEVKKEVEVKKEQTEIQSQGKVIEVEKPKVNKEEKDNKVETIEKIKKKEKTEKLEAVEKKQREKLIERQESLVKKEQKLSTKSTKPINVVLEHELLNKTKSFFNSKSIIITKSKIIRKNSDLEFIVQVPSPIGPIDYYCKVKNKKKINDGDLASVFILGETKKLPTMLLITGELTKKANQMLSEQFKTLKIVNL